MTSVSGMVKVDILAGLKKLDGESCRARRWVRRSIYNSLLSRAYLLQYILLSVEIREIVGRQQLNSVLVIQAASGEILPVQPSGAAGQGCAVFIIHELTIWHLRFRDIFGTRVIRVWVLFGETGAWYLGRLRGRGVPVHWHSVEHTRLTHKTLTKMP